jgi:hypothetical protein
MRIESFRYSQAKCLYVEVFLIDANGDRRYVNYTLNNVPSSITDHERDVEAFLRTRLKNDFTLENYELYRKRVGAAHIHMDGKDYKFIIKDDGQWEVVCRRLNSVTIQDYNLMFNKLNELSNTIQGR